jgi:uncharacterized membrane protein YidH (DUF202 family)
MEQETGAKDSNVPHEYPTSRVSQSPDRDFENRLPNVEGTELDTYPTHADSEASPEPVQESSGQRAPPKQFWRREISLLVEPQACRDHLANERTFLSWLRTSLALSMMGVFTTQLFILQSPRLPHMNLSFFVLGVPLGSLCQAAALVNIITGAYRFWRHQSAMIKGEACAGGWEILLIGILIILVGATLPHKAQQR